MNVFFHKSFALSSNLPVCSKISPKLSPINEFSTPSDPVRSAKIKLSFRKIKVQLTENKHMLGGE